MGSHTELTACFAYVTCCSAEYGFFQFPSGPVFFFEDDFYIIPKHFIAYPTSGQQLTGSVA
jgi:hypothetical protein